MNGFACVTGADRGVGEALARQLLEKEYTVFAGRFSEGWKLLDSLKEEYKDQLHIMDLDISDDSSVKQCADYITGITDRIDILINNGAILGDIQSTVCDELNFDEMLKVYNVNALGSLRMSNSLMPLIMKGNRRLIVNISSEAGSIGTCYRNSWYAYCMSKAALNMQSAITHNQIKESGGQVLIIHPGHVRTYMQGKLDISGTLTPEASAEHILKIVFEHEKYKADKPAFVDYLGGKMEW